MGETNIIPWEVEPLERSRRGVDEWLALATPWLRRRLVLRAMRRPPGSDLRRKLLTRGVRVAAAANNRDDYDSMLVAYHPDVELVPPESGESAIGLDPLYRGHDGVRRFFETWKSGFGQHRYEVREVADAGGRHFAVRFGLAGTIGDSATEIVSELANVNTLEHGLVVRQENFRSWETALDALRRASNG
jgi:SnoaL-like protein